MNSPCASDDVEKLGTGNSLQSKCAIYYNTHKLTINTTVKVYADYDTNHTNTIGIPN